MKRKVSGDSENWLQVKVRSMIHAEARRRNGEQEGANNSSENDNKNDDNKDNNNNNGYNNNDNDNNNNHNNDNNNNDTNNAADLGNGNNNNAVGSGSSDASRENNTIGNKSDRTVALAQIYRDLLVASASQPDTSTGEWTELQFLDAIEACCQQWRAQISE